MVGLSFLGPFASSWSAFVLGRALIAAGIMNSLFCFDATTTESSKQPTEVLVFRKRDKLVNMFRSRFGQLLARGRSGGSNGGGEGECGLAGALSIRLFNSGGGGDRRSDESWPLSET